MPTILLLNGYRFYFFSNENNEPMHIYIVKGNAYGKIWLEPVISIVYLIGFTKTETRELNKIVNKHLDLFKMKWYEYFKK